MRSHVSLAVCGDLPQNRGGSEQQVMRRFSHPATSTIPSGGRTPPTSIVPTPPPSGPNGEG